MSVYYDLLHTVSSDTSRSAKEAILKNWAKSEVLENRDAVHGHRLDVCVPAKRDSWFKFLEKHGWLDTSFEHSLLLHAKPPSVEPLRLPFCGEAAKEKASKAISDSIAHWKRVVSGKDIFISDKYCACCIEYRLCRPRKVFCTDNVGDPCPVCLASGAHSCSGTPWIDLFNHSYNSHRAGQLEKRCPDCKDLSESVLNYLKWVEKCVQNTPIRKLSCKKKQKCDYAASPKI